jgi:hypothetical protein
MYGLRGLGDASDYLNTIAGGSSDTTDTAPGSYINAIGSNAPATSGNSIGTFLNEVTGSNNYSTGSTSQTFSQWVTANSTLLLVAFGAVGALVAITRVGK